MYNFYEELLDKNILLHERLEESYALLGCGSNSSVYEIDSRTVLKVFNFSNYIYSHNLLSFDNSESPFSKIKDVSDINKKINNYLQSGLSYNTAIEKFLIENIFDESLSWFYFCMENKNRNLPKVKNISIDLESCAYFVEQERLDKKESFIIKYGIEKYTEIFKTLKDSLYFLKTTESNCKKKIEIDLNKFLNINLKNKIFSNQIENFFKKILNDDDLYKKIIINTDFHEDNLLFRDNDWVILDPIC